MKKLSNRQQFEEWFKKWDDTYALNRVGDQYYDDATQAAWDAWQHQVRKYKKLHKAASKLPKAAEVVVQNHQPPTMNTSYKIIASTPRPEIDHRSREKITEQDSDFESSTAMKWSRRCAWLLAIVLIIVCFGMVGGAITP